MSSNITAQSTQNTPAQRVCLLTGALGGPTGMRRFLRLLPKGLPVAFIIVQHISPAVLNLLCQFIRRNTAMPVWPGQSGHVISHGEIVIIPSDRQVLLSAAGVLTLRMPDIYSTTPIDDAMTVFAQHYGKQVGAIVFSGIADDASQGSFQITGQGGEVWTQSEQSCRYASMPRYVTQACHVSFSAAPEHLAARLLKELTDMRRQNPRAMAG